MSFSSRKSHVHATILCTLAVVAAALTWTGLATTAHAALPPSAKLSLDHVVRTSPFAGSSVSAKDNEGSAYVAKDSSLWIADDDARKIYEVNVSTGALKRSIDASTFAATPRLGGGALAGADRSRDLESIAYDESADTLYVFSGSCCTTTVLPTAYRLTRVSGKFQPTSYQPLLGSDFTAAAWNPVDKKIYVGINSELRTYTYTSNTAGAPFTISGVTGIFGMDFTNDGKDLFIARSPSTVTRVNWSTKSVVSGWNLDLKSYGLLDARAVEVINDQLWVSDGYDFRALGDPLSHAVFVIDVGGSGTPDPTDPTGPTASFSASPTSGTAPLAVKFTDTSTGSPTTWKWEFGDGDTSSSKSPSHTYATAGTFTAKLTVTSSGGSSSATQQISVSQTTSPSPSPTPQPSPPPSPTPPPAPGTAPFLTNLVVNSGFETDLHGWDATGKPGAELARVEHGRHSTWSGRARSAVGTGTVRLDDVPNWVATTGSGTYTATLWVRAHRPGQTVVLRLREVQGGKAIAMAHVAAPLHDHWQKLTVTLEAHAPGSSTLDLTAVAHSSGRRASFRSDDAVLTVG